jgi:hypothetical protein
MLPCRWTQVLWRIRFLAAGKFTSILLSTTSSNSSDCWQQRSHCGLFLVKLCLSPLSPVSCVSSLYYPTMNHSFTDIDMNSPISQPDGFTLKGWTLPAIVLESSGQGLANVSRETLDQCMHPILEGLANIDAEELLSLERVPEGTAGGAHLHSG